MWPAVEIGKGRRRKSCTLIRKARLSRLYISLLLFLCCLPKSQQSDEDKMHKNKTQNSACRKNREFGEIIVVKWQSISSGKKKIFWHIHTLEDVDALELSVDPSRLLLLMMLLFEENIQFSAPSSKLPPFFSSFESKEKNLHVVMPPHCETATGFISCMVPNA